MKYPKLLNHDSIKDSYNTLTSISGNKGYPARPMGFCSIKDRFKLAYNVFIGKYDAFDGKEE